jgi:hypothetical protein
VVENLMPRDPTQNPYAEADQITTVAIGAECQ